MKRWICMLTVLLICLTLAVTVWAATPLVADHGDLLTEAEEQQLNAKLSAINGAQVVVLTVDSLGTKSAMAYADDYFDAHYGTDGILLLVSMAEREWWISTSGSCISRFPTQAIDSVSDRFLPYLSAGAYYDAFAAYAAGCRAVLEDGPYIATESRGVPAHFILISLAIGAVVGFVATGVMKGQLKSIRSAAAAESYVRPGSMQVTRSADRFLYHTTTRRAKPQNNSGGSHRGSSGRRHGGGGGRF